MSTPRKRSGRRVAPRRAEEKAQLGDVTINDFANAWRSHARFKKATTNISSKMKQEATVQEEEEVVKDSWEEHDDDYVAEEEKSKKSGKSTATIQRRNRKGQSSESDKEEDEGIDYPLDMWFIISEYIKPEVVGKFALICRSTYYVTTTGKFWFHLYKSYYTDKCKLPVTLQPQCLVSYGLRIRVIRMLHHAYFATKKHQDPHSLVKRRCCLMWHKEGLCEWHFYFKLKEITKSGWKSLRRKTAANWENADILDLLEDIDINPEDGCKLLKVTCLKYSMLPPVIGLILQTVSVHLMPGFRYHKMKLGFGTSDVPDTLTHQVVLTDMVHCEVMDWWHPSYPYQLPSPFNFVK